MNKQVKLKGIDSGLLVSTGLLLLVGLVILQSASGPISNTFYDDVYYELVNQLIKGVLPGIVIFFIFANLKFNLFKKFAIFGWIITMGLNIMVLVSRSGVTVKGATRWLDIAGFRIQPSEILKLAIILCLSALLTQLGKKINNIGALILTSSIIGIGAGIVIFGQTSLSNGIILLVISASILFQSKLKFRFIAIFMTVILIVGIVAISGADFRKARFFTFVDLENATPDDKIQIENNLIAVGSGGLTGVGLGESRQKFFYLPEASTDSIFAVFAEESGFIGALILVILFLFIIWRILWLHTKVADEFSRYILIGGATWISFQTFLNIATTIQLAPVTGVTLPLVSAGGSSMIVFLGLFGIIANISKYRK
jgi:cell division protein FtsW